MHGRNGMCECECLLAVQRQCNAHNFLVRSMMMMMTMTRVAILAAAAVVALTAVTKRCLLHRIE